MLLVEIDVTLPQSSRPSKINLIVKKRRNVNMLEPEITWKINIFFAVPMFILTTIGIGTIYHMYKKINSPRIMKHISATP